MFGIGMPELLLILGVALIVVGPSKLPDLAKSLAKGLGEFRKATDEVKATITEHEGIKELRELKDSVQGTVDSLKPSSLMDLEAKPAGQPEVAPVVQLKKFEAPAAEPAVEPAVEPKKPEERLEGRMQVLDNIVAEHSQPAAEPAHPAPASAAPPKANV